MEDSYVYISVKLYIEDGNTEDSVHEIIQDMDYSFNHQQIIEHEIVDILDMQLPISTTSEGQYIDPYDLSSLEATASEQE